ncbi:MAG TPA: nitroreductase/quinone reductase family protein [candidate division Zixibacteria bacterium]|nr:nitroreductase/quinone reductase family protein [candidate division Zixibacteria bacterium]
MVRSFQFSLDRKIVNLILSWMLERGVSPRNYFLLTVPGRITGKPHTVPVAVVTQGKNRWLVAPYGVVDWVKNARASGKVTLSRGKKCEKLILRELPFNEAAPVLKSYIESYPIAKSYISPAVDSPDHEFVPEAKIRPVFELIPSLEKVDA